jgi:hypothetical protein
MEQIKMQGERFSFVEFCAIIIVLTITAISFSPRFSQADTHQKDMGRLIDSLERVRSSLDLYRIEHEGNLPQADSFESFKNCMCSKQNRPAPYIKRIPVNPLNNKNTVRFNGEPAGSNMAGWRLDTKSGLFQADNDSGCAAL